MKLDRIVVSETFYSIQGEGQTMGIPSVFLRLGGCNLFCDGKWRCDTIEVWQKGHSKEFKDVLSAREVAELECGAHLIITGGEPLMQQDQIVNYLNWFQTTFKFTPIIEIETNGTIIPNEIMLDKVDYWNVSPKLANSGEPFSKRVNEVAILTLKSKTRNHIFKFVINEKEDFLEMCDSFSFIISDEAKENTDIWLMPAGESQEKLLTTRKIVAELCKMFSLRYSDRLHIGIWDKKTGV